MMYRIVNGLVAIPPFELYTTSSVARGHIDSLSHMSELHPIGIPSSQTVYGYGTAFHNHWWIVPPGMPSSKGY